MKRSVLWILVVLLFANCNLPKKKPNVREALTGDWLVLYPDHQWLETASSSYYAKMQDSIVNIMGLKLLSFKPDGIFQQLDSLYRQQGKWQLSANELQVIDGGKGWNAFNGRLVGFTNDTLKIVEYIPMPDSLKDSIKVTWHLKKINPGDKAAILFDDRNNQWRSKPLEAETDAQIKAKLKAMLDYYASYYEVVSRESIYFTGSRVFLPFKYYQHGMGLLPFKNKDAFSKMFFNEEQAKKAYDFLEHAFDKSRKINFPSGDNFVIEYSRFLERMEGNIG